MIARRLSRRPVSIYSQRIGSTLVVKKFGMAKQPNIVRVGSVVRAQSQLVMIHLLLVHLLVDGRHLLHHFLVMVFIIKRIPLRVGMVLMRRSVPSLIQTGTSSVIVEPTLIHGIMARLTLPIPIRIITVLMVSGLVMNIRMTRVKLGQCSQVLLRSWIRMTKLRKRGRILQQS